MAPPPAGPAAVPVKVQFLFGTPPQDARPQDASQAQPRQPHRNAFFCIGLKRDTMKRWSSPRHRLLPYWCVTVSLGGGSDLLDAQGTGASCGLNGASTRGAGQVRKDDTPHSQFAIVAGHPPLLDLHLKGGKRKRRGQQMSGQRLMP